MKLLLHHLYKLIQHCAGSISLKKELFSQSHVSNFDLSGRSTKINGTDLSLTVP